MSINNGNDGARQEGDTRKASNGPVLCEGDEETTGGGGETEEVSVESGMVDSDKTPVQRRKVKAKGARRISPQAETKGAD